MQSLILVNYFGPIKEQQYFFTAGNLPLCETLSFQENSDSFTTLKYKIVIEL